MSEAQSFTYFGRDLEAMSFADNYHRWILSELRPFLGKRVAEIGAGNGNFTSFLAELQLEHLVCFEPSHNMYAELERRFGTAPGIETIQDYFGNKAADYRDQFDSVMYINVLEHIEDDRGELEHAWSAIRPGGHLLLFVPALPFLFSEFDRKVGHFRRYTRDQLTRTVQEAGFDIRKLRYFDLAGILPWYLACVLLKLTPGGGTVSLYDRIAVPIMRGIERLVTPPIGKNLLLIAQKPD